MSKAKKPISRHSNNTKNSPKKISSEIMPVMSSKAIKKQFKNPNK
jgi:hypothetical protein